jgi:hypothetical protein
MMMIQEHGENPVQPFPQRERAGNRIQCTMQHTHRWNVTEAGVPRDPAWEFYRRYVHEFRGYDVNALTNLAPRFNVFTGSRPNKDLLIAAIAANATLVLVHGENYMTNFAVRPIIAQDIAAIRVPNVSASSVNNDRWTQE